MSRGPSRSALFGDQIKRILSSALTGILKQNLPDERLRNVVVTDVKISTDKSVAKVFYTSLGNTLSQEDTRELLTENRGWLRSALARELRSRRTPDLTFHVDNALEYGRSIDRLLDEINKESGGEHSE